MTKARLGSQLPARSRKFSTFAGFAMPEIDEADAEDEAAQESERGCASEASQDVTQDEDRGEARRHEGRDRDERPARQPREPQMPWPEVQPEPMPVPRPTSRPARAMPARLPETVCSTAPPDEREASGAATRPARKAKRQSRSDGAPAHGHDRAQDTVGDARNAGDLAEERHHHHGAEPDQAPPKSDAQGVKSVTTIRSIVRSPSEGEAGAACPRPSPRYILAQAKLVKANIMEKASDFQSPPSGHAPSTWPSACRSLPTPGGC